jgi:hypothetical protein
MLFSELAPWENADFRRFCPSSLYTLSLAVGHMFWIVQDAQERTNGRRR